MTRAQLLLILTVGAAAWVLALPRPEGASLSPVDSPSARSVDDAARQPVLPHRKPRPRTTANPKADFVVAKSATCPFDPTIEVTCDLPESLRLRNTGGMGPRGPGSGAGLCVFTSIEHCGRYQNEIRVVGLQKKMTGERGGGHPEKLDQMMAKYCSGVDYAQHVDGKEEFLRLGLKTGRLLSVTYCGVDGLPDHYGDEVIAHKCNLVYLDDKYAAILDNNFPNEILWMSRENFLCRWKGIKPDGSPFLARDRVGRRFPVGGGWADLLLNPAPPPPPRN